MQHLFSLRSLARLQRRGADILEGKVVEMPRGSQALAPSPVDLPTECFLMRNLVADNYQMVSLTGPLCGLCPAHWTVKAN